MDKAGIPGSVEIKMRTIPERVGAVMVLPGILLEFDSRLKVLEQHLEQQQAQKQANFVQVCSCPLNWKEQRAIADPSCPIHGKQPEAGLKASPLTTARATKVNLSDADGWTVEGQLIYDLQQDKVDWPRFLELEERVNLMASTTQPTPPSSQSPGLAETTSLVEPQSECAHVWTDMGLNRMLRYSTGIQEVVWECNKCDVLRWRDKIRVPAATPTPWI